MNRLIAAAALGASLLAAAPLTAQTAQETARFTAAQDRMANELQVFRAESDRYRAAVARRPGGYQQQQYNDPRYDDPRNDGGYDNGGYRRADDIYYDPSPDYAAAIIRNARSPATNASIAAPTAAIIASATTARPA